MELGDCDPFLSRLTLQCLQYDVKLEGKIILAHRSSLGVDRVAGPLNHGMVADAVDLTKFGENFLNLVSIFKR